MTTRAELNLRWASLIIQLEALAMLVSPALALLISDRIRDPRAAIVMLVLAPIIWRIGYGIGHGSRGAYLAVAFLYATRLLGAFVSPMGKAPTFDYILLGLEGVAIALAFYAFHLGVPNDKSWRGKLRIETALVIIAAILWVARSESIDLLCILLLGTAVIFSVRTHLLRTLLDALGNAGVHAADIPERPEFKTQFARFVRSPIPDFLAAAVFGGLSWLVLVGMARFASQPSAMGTPSMLLFPIFALIATPLAVLWVVSGFAVWARKPWARGVRLTALCVSALIGLALADIIGIIVTIALESVI